MSDKYEGLGLSDAEIAAMEDDFDETDDDVAEVDTDDDAPVAEPVTPEPVAADEPVAAQPEPEPQQAKPEPQPPVTAPDPGPSKVDQLNAEMVELKKKFDEGDVSIDEYIDARDLLSRKIVKAELSQELAAQEVAKTWERSQQNFLSQHSYLRDDVIFDAFAMQVNKLLADPSSAAMTDEALLSAAKAKVDAAFGRKSEPSKKDESPIRDAKKEAANRNKVPATLQGVPAAAPADDVEQSPFAYLDRLSGEQLEAAVAKLSQADQVRWLHSQ